MQSFFSLLWHLADVLIQSDLDLYNAAVAGVKGLAQLGTGAGV